MIEAQLKQRRTPAQKTYYELGDLNDSQYDPTKFYKKLDVLLIRPQEMVILPTFPLFFLPMKLAQYLGSLTYFLFKNMEASEQDLLQIGCNLFEVYLCMDVIFEEKSPLSIQQLENARQKIFSTVSVLQKYSNFFSKYVGVVESFEHIKDQISTEQWGKTQALVAFNVEKVWKSSQQGPKIRYIVTEIMNIDFVLLKKSNLLNQVIDTSFQKVFQSLNDYAFTACSISRIALKSNHIKNTYDPKFSLKYLNSQPKGIFYSYRFVSILCLTLKVSAQYITYCRAVVNKQKLNLINSYFYQWARAFSSVSMCKLLYTGKNDKNYGRTVINEAIQKVRRYHLPGIINIHVQSFQKVRDPNQTNTEVLLDKSLSKQKFTHAIFASVSPKKKPVPFQSYESVKDLLIKYKRKKYTPPQVPTTGYLDQRVTSNVDFAYALGIIYQCSQLQEQDQKIFYMDSAPFRKGYQKALETQQNFAIDLDFQSDIMKLIRSNNRAIRYLSKHQNIQSFILNVSATYGANSFYQTYFNKVKAMYEKEITKKAFFQAEQSNLLKIFKEIFQERQVSPMQIVKNLLMLSVGSTISSFEDMQYYNLEELLGKFLSPVLKLYIDQLNKSLIDSEQSKQRYIHQISVLAESFDVTPFLEVDILKNDIEMKQWIIQKKEEGIKKIMLNSEARAKGKGELMMYEMHLENLLDNQIQNVKIFNQKNEVTIQQFSKTILQNAISSKAVIVK